MLEPEHIRNLIIAGVVIGTLLGIFFVWVNPDR